MSQPSLFSLQGYLNIGELLPNGKIGKLRWLGNVPEATVQLSVEAEDKKEDFSGNRNLLDRLQTGTSAVLNYTLDYWSSANMALAFNATAAAIAASTVTGEVFPEGLVAGDLVRLDNPFASSLVITDSAGTPATLVADTNYRIKGHSANTVEILDPGSFVQPFNGAYSYEAATNLVLFSQLGTAAFLQFDGINTKTGEPVLFEFWKARHDPIKELGLINKQYGNLPMTAALLFDETRALDPLLGGVGRALQKAA
jgi:hypothetical protein